MLDHAPVDRDARTLAAGAGRKGRTFGEPRRMRYLSPVMSPRDRLAEFLAAAQRGVVFTGAGISTESGVPDFRSPGGVWSRMRPIHFGQFLASEALRRESWSRVFANSSGWVGARPNAGHDAIARLVAHGKIASVITQNVDNLHQDSGVPARQVIELHGNASYALCLSCGRRYELAELRSPFVEHGVIPVCRACGGIVKTATISFGQPMPRQAMRRAREATLSCDLFLVLGSSLSVFPAADFPLLAKQNGARLVIVNREATGLDKEADIVLHEEIGCLMAVLVRDGEESVRRRA